MLTRRIVLGHLARAGIATALSDVARAIGDSATSRRRPPGIVQTVLGPIEASKLGFTLPHEHICASSQGFLQTWPEYFGGRSNFVSKVVDKLEAAKDEGVDTIVDVTPADVGRDVRLLEEVSHKSGMQIVACTGHSLYPSLSMAARTVDEIAEFFVLEIERGLEGTDIKPGVIKVATDREGATPFLEKALRAAARASKATGVRVTTHTHAGSRTGTKQAEIFEQEGLDPAKVCLGHSDDSNDLEYLTGLVQRGYTVGMDHMTWGIQGTEGAASHTLSWQERADCVKKLIDSGYGSRIFLSNDWYFATSIAGPEFMNAKEKLNPDGMLFNNRKTIPYLRRIGVSDRSIHAITVENPKRFFGGLE